ncbi:MAG: hypothetical protein H0W72_04305 [Planctomycetes bacterium]|nr:hypothetical protein [Planctomycetota bacterium]
MRPSTRSSRRTPVASRSARSPSAAPQRRPSSARLAPASDETGTHVHGRRQAAGPINAKTVAALVVVVLGIAAIASYPAIMRSVYLGRLDKATGAEATAAAKTYVDFVHRSVAHVRNAVRDNRGPVEAQIWMAREAGSYAALVDILERTHPEPTPEQRAEALKAAEEIFDRERDGRERHPRSLEAWAKTAKERDVAIAAIALVAKINNDSAPETLCAVAGEPGQDPLRVAAALDGLAAIANPDNIGMPLGLLTGNASDAVMAHDALRGRIVASVGADHLERLLGLLGNPIPGIRALALEAMGTISLPDGPEMTKRRQELGEKVAAKLTRDTPPVELAAALKAAKGLRLTGARDAVLALVPIRAQVPLPGIDDRFYSDTLGGAFIFARPDQARVASEDLIGKLTALLDDAGSRIIAADALAMINDPAFLALRPALDKLAALGENPACFTALTALVGKTLNRADVVKSNGRDLDRWQRFLAEDRPRYTRVAEIHAWYVQNKQFQLISDGKKKLTENREYLDKARDDLQAMLDDPKFVPPLGMTLDQVKTALQDVNELGISVRKAWSGAMSH